MARPIWTGAISFGLVNVPVRLYSAIGEHKLHFHFVHQKDDSRIGYEKVCKLEDKPVPNDEIVKAYEYEKGEYVYMSDEDFEAAETEAGFKTITIDAFVPYEQLDPIFFSHTYYVGPNEGAERPYALLVRAMENSDLAAIAKFAMRNREYLAALRVRERVITLEQMYFADEIRPIDEIKPSSASVPKKELEMAERLVESFTQDFDPSQYHDTYHDILCDVINAKRKGKEVHHAAQPEEPEETVDLLEALRASVERHRRTGRTTRRPRSRAPSGSVDADELESLTKTELERRAREAGISGRSKMSKRELARALAKAA